MHNNLNRFQAFAIHLLISATILGSFLTFIYWVWYPQPFFVVEGIENIIWVLIGVDLVLGPALTLIVYNTEKPGLKRDLLIIVLIQVIGFSYGAHTMYTERPYFAVIYDSTSFEVLEASVIKDLSETPEELMPSFFSRPKFVFAKKPKSREELEKILEAMKKGAPAIGQNPKYFKPLKGNLSSKWEFSLDLDSLEKNAGNQKAVENFKAKYGDRVHQLRYFPIVGKFTARILVIDPDLEAVIDYIDINPNPAVDTELK
jgi:hypothetical protein